MKEGTRKLLDKAERAIRAAQTLLDAADAEFAAGRTYSICDRLPRRC